MIDIVLVFDELDANIGQFNQGCNEDFDNYFNGSDFRVNTINSRLINEIVVGQRTAQLNNFIFVAYCHGQEDKLCTSNDSFITTTINNQNFRNSFFYTVSCDAGKNLGNVLIENGCLNFFGYKSLFNSWLGYKQFSHCANYGFFKFMDGQNSDIVFTEMKLNYNESIDDLVVEDYLVAALLRENRDGLVNYGEVVNVSNFISILD